MNDNILLRRLAGFGIMGGLLMLFGDICFYGRAISGADFMRSSMMTEMPPSRLIIGGVVGPLAGLLYGLGAMMFYVAFRDHEKRLARIVSALFVVMFVMGGAYHAVYATYGFAAVPDAAGTTALITAHIDAMHKVSFVTGVSASLLFIYMVLRYDTVFPKWILIFTPTFWTLINGAIGPYIPYPIGSFIIGGWVNLCFIVFFALSYFVFVRAAKTP